MKGFVKFSLVIFLILGAAYWYLKKDFSQTPPTLYSHGHIITMDSLHPFAEAMLVIDGKIKAIGAKADVEALTKVDVAQVDLKGATVLPGFIDPHTHFMLTMFMADMVDLSGFKHSSNEEVWNFFAQAVKDKSKGEWIICKGIDPVLVGDLVPPTLAFLDEMAPDNPVLIFSQSLHSYWANSDAFAKVGISVETPAPSKNSYYEKKDGVLTGLIVEQEAVKPFLDIIKRETLTPAKMVANATKVMDDYAHSGNTTIVSAGLTITDKKPLMLAQHLSDEKVTLLGSVLQKIGKFPKRKPAPRHFIYMRYDRTNLIPNSKPLANDFYGIIGVKHWYDGAPYIGSMYLNEPYLESALSVDKLHIPKGHRGEALVKKDDFRAFIKKSHQQGLQIAIHVQGDAAAKEVLDAFESLAGELDFSQSKHRIEHCLLLPQKELDRMKSLNITPSFHINHLYYYGDALKSGLVGEDRAKMILPVGAAAQKGIRFSLHADQPMFASHPFKLIQTAVERKTKSGVVIGEEQKISVMQAIKALTIDAAWQINMDDRIGSLQNGKYADFIVLDRNPLTIPTDQLSHVKCVKTFINGELVE